MPNFFFTDDGTPYIYTLSLHDALPIYRRLPQKPGAADRRAKAAGRTAAPIADVVGEARARNSHAVSDRRDRKSTRLNSSHRCISYAVFCSKKKIGWLAKILCKMMGIRA